MRVQTKTLAILVGLAVFLAAAGTALAAPVLSRVPANEAKIAALLMRLGKIPAGADADAIEAAVQKYLQGVEKNKAVDRPNPEAFRKLLERERSLARAGANAPYQGKKMGQSVSVPNATVVPYSGPVKKDKALMLLVEFTADEYSAGPAHNELPEPDWTTDNTSFWVSDFNPEHYQTMLYGTGPGVRSMANYYLEQSNGQYTVDGQAYGWYQVPHSEAYYGRDTAEGEVDGGGAVPVYEVIRDALAVIPAEAIPWDEYDEDGDGYLDHVMIIHAGAGQEAGGGAQGEDAIWSHSWFADYANGGIPIPGTDKKIGPYIIMPEDGTIGVFCHEFGHNLGLPDEYDTIYSGEASTGFWSLMSSGSWLGYPGGALGTSPSGISAWGRMALGWVTPAAENGLVRVNVDQLREGPVEVTLDAAELRGSNPKFLRIDLPNKSVVQEINVPYSGAQEWWSQAGDELDNRLWRVVDLTGAASATLKFATWYDIEEGWDYGYVEVSTDAGTTWQSIPGSITTSDNPNGTNAGNGITGTSGDWVAAVFDLTPFAGKEIRLRFRYSTDTAVQGKGWCIDNVEIPEIGFYDDVEAGNFGWVAEPASDDGGWTVFAGSRTLSIPHYYLLELRTHRGFDEGLRACYNYAWLDTLPNMAEFFSYNPGVLVWYRDMQYADNWVGVHPGHGYLLVVDAHDTPIRSIKGIPWRTRMQVRDATFGRDRTLRTTLTRFDKTQTYPSLPAIPLFNDTQDYWNPSVPTNSVLTPTYGVNFKVMGVSEDGTSVRIGVFLDNGHGGVE